MFQGLFHLSLCHELRNIFHCSYEHFYLVLSCFRLNSFQAFFLQLLGYLTARNHSLLYYLFQHVYALQQLENHLKEGACALDVGSGSGYLTAAMAYMVNISACYQ